MTRPVRKAIIPVAGLGTRMLPATKAIAKELLPVADKPVIQHVVEEAIAAGIEQIILVTRSGKNAIEDHFDGNFEIEHQLVAKGKTALLKSITTIVPPHVQIISVRQPEALGLGHAIHCASELVDNDEPFVVMLPDVLVLQEHRGENDLKRMTDNFAKSGAAQIMVEAVPENKTQIYGIADCSGVNPEAGESVAIAGMVEKPRAGTAPSNLAVVGRYVLPGEIMKILGETAPGAGNEIQLTDALDSLLKAQKPMDAYRMTAKTYDCGNRLGFLCANIVVGLQLQETKEGLEDFIKSLNI